VRKDNITLLGGLPGAMKTYVALSMVKSLLTEEELFDCFPVNEPANRVLYLIPESSISAFKERLVKLDLMRFVGHTFFCRTLSAAEMNVPLTDPRILKAAEGADVFLDTAVQFMEGDENDSGEQRIFAQNLFALLRAEARTVVGLHHAPKAFNEKDEMTLENVLRGAGDIGAMCATVWGLSKTDKEKAQVYIQCVKDRDFSVTPQPFLIEGRPHLDEKGKFKLLHGPGSGLDYKSIKQQQRGAKGGRKKRDVSPEVAAKIVKLHREGKSNRAIADETGETRQKVDEVIAINEMNLSLTKASGVPTNAHERMSSYQVQDVAIAIHAMEQAEQAAADRKLAGKAAR